MKKLTVENKLVQGKEIHDMDTMSGEELAKIGEELNHRAMAAVGYEKDVKATA